MTDDRSTSWGARGRTRLAELAGQLDYFRRPEWRPDWAFNGQAGRRALFAELAAHVPFAAIVETGTAFGVTTRYLRQETTLPIFSFESNPRRYGFARANLRGLRDLHLHRGDSRSGLAGLAEARALPSGPPFFYLDAHWRGDLPLAEEIALAFAHWPDGIIMIDDFAVPDDPGYGFDDYGTGEALTLSYLGENGISPRGVWFPRCRSEDETGARRGCVVLANAEPTIGRIDSVSALRRWNDTTAQ